MQEYKITDEKKIEEVLKSKVLGTPDHLRYKGNAILKNGKWDFDLLVIIVCENGEYEESFYISMQMPTKEEAIHDIRKCIEKMSKDKMFGSKVIDMKGVSNVQ